MTRAIQEVPDESLRRDVIELIEKVLVYKFTNKSREELHKMIYTESEWKQSKLYQSLKEEATKDAREQVKLESVVGFLKLGLTVEQIATGLDLSIEKVRQIQEEQSSS